MKTISSALIVTACCFFVLNASAQFVGIGTTTPAAPLQIINSGITNVGLMMSDSIPSQAGRIAFKNLNRIEKMNLIGYSGGNFYGNQFLDVWSDSMFVATFRGNGNVGIRNLSPMYPLDITGAMNLNNGAMRMNGLSGAAGQVLTSNGTNTPSWETAAFGGNTRFSFNTNQFNGNQGNDSMTFANGTANYNLNPAAVSFASGNNARLVFSQAGLYHFEGSIYYEISNIANKSIGPTINSTLFVNSKGYTVVPFNLMFTQNSLPTGQWQYEARFNVDLYLTAGSTIKLVRQFSGYSGSAVTFSFGNFTGYLVSE